jgi:ribonucleoside-diphosphate reductase alpha chain
MSSFAREVFELRYAHDVGQRKETWEEAAERVVPTVFKAVDAPKALVRECVQMVVERKFIPGGRYLYATGRPYHQTQNCLLLRADDSREGWSSLMQKATQALMTGAGIGVVYSDLRAKGKPIRKTGGVASGPCALMQMVNEAGRFVRQGGARRSAIWAGLHWNHPDILDFVKIKDWPEEIKALKDKSVEHPAPMDGTNVSVILDDAFFRAIENEDHRDHELAKKVYWATVKQMLRTAEPGFSIDVGKNRGESLRNACTEITSHDDSDICNLGSVNLARIGSLEEMARVVEVGVAFLLAGTVYSDVPYQDVDRVRTKNRRLGLGMMGIHEWLLTHGKKYGPDPDLEQYLKVYSGSGDHANRWADEWELSRPVKTRAIAPNGTIGIVSETTTGIEPVFCVAYKRRYYKNDAVNYQYVVDPTAKRLIEGGTAPEAVEDAYTLAEDVERRVAFQVWVQGYVDHAISSTINLPAWGSELNNEHRVRGFGNMLLRHLPSLRGITCYPDGARGGQPLTPVKYETAMGHVGKVFVEQADACDITKGTGSCGS